MEITEDFVNKVANSGLITFDLAQYRNKEERVLYDIKDNLFQELILREKDFRAFVKDHPWEQYKNKHVAVMCSADAIVPTWAYMLLAVKLEPFAKTVFFGSLAEMEAHLFEQALNQVDFSVYKDERVVVKGCSDVDVPVAAYVSLTARLRPLVKSIMYGEPCSTVPLYKSKD